MKQLVLVLIAALIYTGAYSQHNTCYSTEVIKQKRLADPVYDAELKEQEQATLKRKALGHKDASYESRAVRTIPVVVHVIYNTPQENVTDAVINAMIAKLNACYRKLNTADISSSRVAVQGFATDAQIEFCLAQRKPDGTSTNGIDRVTTTVTCFDADNAPNAMKSANTGGADDWNPFKYLNIYIVDLCQANANGGIAGYAYLPTQGVVGSYIDGLVIDYQIGLGPDYTTAVHEIGHWLNLHHTWGDLQGNACGNSFPATDDSFDDTPDSRDPHYSCSPLTSCTNNSSYGDQYENFMDYSSCPSLFTPEQCVEMNSILSGIRDDLFINNLGCTAPVSTPPTANFTASATAICVGQSVTFTNTTTGSPTITYSWSFPGGTPSTSTAANPTVTYNTAGVYNVVLTATNGQGNDVETKNAFITVGGASGTLPLVQGFETATFPPTGWSLINGDADKTWERRTSVSGFGTSSASAYVHNFDYNASGQKDWLVTPSFSFASVPNGRIRWEYANARYQTSNDSLELFYSTNCGATWTSLWRRGGASLATASATTADFVPTSTQWRRDSVSLASLSGQTNVRFAFVNRTAYGNNTFLDNINIYNVGTTQVVAPVANFVGTPTTVVAGNTVAFTDLSTNTPTSWSWTFAGGTPGTATTQNPVVTYNTPGTYAVTLTATNSAGSDGETKTAYITVITQGGGTLSCDTLSNIQTGDTLTVYGLGPGNGYLTGHNRYNDKAKAQFYPNTSAIQVTGGLFYFILAKTLAPATSTIAVKVWNADGTAGAPGTVLATQNVLISSIAQDIANQDFTAVNFNTPANVTGNYYIGFEMTYITGDTVALVSTQFNSPDPDYGWEQWNDNSWHSFSDVADYPDGFDLVIFPSECTSSAPQGPTASFTANDRTVCAGTTVSFTSTSTGTPTSYSWSFPGGTPSTSTVANPTVNYPIAGVYNVSLTVSNANGNNTSNQSAFVTVYALPTLTTSSTAVACFGASTGSATVTAAGASPFTYNWSGGGTTPTITNKPQGTYTVSVSDVNLCTSTASVNISQPLSALSATVDVTDATCGQQNGSVTINPAGGAGNYTYAWAGGSTAQTRTNLAAGTYTVTVSDANQCTAVVTATVANNIISFTVNITTVNASCGLNNGSATATISNPNLTVSSYQWNTGATSGTITNLAAGNYAVTVTLSNGCSASNSAVITNVPSSTTLSFNSTNATCGLADGSSTVTANGGTSPYSYLWSDATITNTISNKTAGSYSVTVSDANGCSTTGTAAISNTGAPLVMLSVAQPTCFNSTDGSITTSVSGGATPYLYNWSSVATTPSISNLGAGTYVVTVIDAAQCQAVQSAVLVNPTAVDGVINVTNATCGLNNGSATVVGAGGNNTYSYVWANGIAQPTISNLGAGSYAVTITDGAGCSTVKAATLTSSGAVSVAVNAVNPTQGNNGSATATVSGGTAPYLYSWSNGGSSPAITNLGIGSYSVTVTDANNCQSTGSVTLVGTSIKNVKGITLVKVYPNPANAKLNVVVELTDAQNINVEIFNSIGQQMWQKEYSNYNTLTETIDISSFAQGVYMVRIKANESIKTIRLIKE